MKERWRAESYLGEVPDEAREDKEDATKSSQHDQLQRWGWKFLEYIPLLIKTSKSIKNNKKWGYKLRFVRWAICSLDAS